MAQDPKNPLLGEVVHCRLCDKDERLGWNHQTNSACKERGVCFSCNFWLERAAAFKGAPMFIIDGTHYTMCEESGNKSFRGFGGQQFLIADRATGRVYETTNLWCQGDVPAHFKHLLPDTADFIDRNRKWVEIDGIQYLAEVKG